VIGDVDVEEFAALVAEHDEHEQEAKGQGWHEGSDQEMQWRGKRDSSRSLRNSPGGPSGPAASDRGPEMEGSARLQKPTPGAQFALPSSVLSPWFAP
jgi:hypothetical protein